MRNLSAFSVIFLPFVSISFYDLFYVTGLLFVWLFCFTQMNYCCLRNLKWTLKSTWNTARFLRGLDIYFPQMFLVDLIKVLNILLLFSLWINYIYPNMNVKNLNKLIWRLILLSAWKYTYDLQLLLYWYRNIHHINNTWYSRG